MNCEVEQPRSDEVACDRPAAASTSHTLVIGVGNPIVTDDSVGIRVAELLRERLRGREGVVVETDCWGGLRLMERMVGFDRAIVIDAACMGERPGTISVLSCRDARTQHSSSAHDMDIVTALEFGRRAGAELPRNEAVVFVAIEALNINTFGRECTPYVALAIPRAVCRVEQLLAESRRRN